MFKFSAMTDPSPPSSSVNDPLLVFGADGAPRSQRHGDVYYSLHDGLAESRMVFLTGCDLARVFAQPDPVVRVGETGFGTGLNQLAILDLWAQVRRPGARLELFSFEGFLMRREDAARALFAFPELAPLAEQLLAQWPTPPFLPGFHRFEFPALNAHLDLYLGEAAEALLALKARQQPQQAWLLDGFSPALNPDMWRQEVLDLIGINTVPGGRAASFTVAGFVRRGLVAAGFEVFKRPGHGKKRERLEAVRL